MAPFSLQIKKKKEAEGAIAQIILPFIAPGATPISSMVSVVCEGDEWTYFYGGYPVYTHQANDHKMFRFITAQLVASGACKQVDIINCFGVSKNSVLRSVNKEVRNRFLLYHAVWEIKRHLLPEYSIR